MDNQFEPPRHWIGIEELEEAYWKDPVAQEKRGQEFYEKPIEYLEKLDQTGQTGMARREFLTAMGASMAMASFACARRPVNKIIPYVVKPEEVVPGVSTWYASTCRACDEGCGILVKNREGRPIKLEGNPDHPVNQGALCAQGQASVLGLYDTDRLKGSLIRSGQSAKEISWKDADAAIVGKLNLIASTTGRVRVLTGKNQGESTRSLVQDFLSGFKQGKHVEYDPLCLEEIANSQKLSYGTAVVPHYRFEKAQLIVSFGADFLGTWLSSVENKKNWAKNRKLSPSEQPGQAKLSKVVCFEPTMSLTGANSDERYLVRPGDELKVALALAYELIINRRVTRFAGNDAVGFALAGYSPEKVAADIGLEEPNGAGDEGGARALKKLAAELWTNRGQSLVVGGGIQVKTKDALALQVAINLLNSALENEGTTVDGNALSQEETGFSGMMELIADMEAGRVDALIIHDVNPAYTLPPLGGAAGGKFEAAIKKVPLVVMATEADHETAQFAHYVLADHHYLENWGDAHPRPGLYSLQQPTLAPIHDTRSFQDSLITWIRTAAQSNGFKGGSRAQKADNWHEYLKSYWKDVYYPKSGAVSSFESFWESALRLGVYNPGHYLDAKSTPRSFNVSSLGQIPKYATPKYSQLTLALYEKISMGDGRHANNAWLQELPDPISAVTWDNYLNVSPSLAKEYHLKENDVVEIKSEGTDSQGIKAQLPVHVQPGLHPGVVSVAVGYGRKAAGNVGNEAGVNVYPFVQVEGQGNNKTLTFSGQAVSLRKTGRFYTLASSQWHTATENRPVINDITLIEYKKKPNAANHTNPHLRPEEIATMWPKHEYKDYRWGMSIDLNSCTGCGACVIACQAENNVPVVGREQVRNSRLMHWIRIDRYYSGSSSNPDMLFQPMLCQHCENAPCETVCPVLATVHDNEGLNVQVYNRCVGTRYCQNNCPYKVRRFNFFDHWKSYEGTMNLVWNPDVTVRTRGIMEKCTFCVQRIRESKDKAKDMGTRVTDADLKTACQQTCPTQAITFGDMNNQSSEVSVMKASPRAFGVLEVLNTRPSIAYLTKVRNKVGSAHASEGAQHA